MSFHVEDGYLYCESLKVKDIQDTVPESPFYLYSLSQLRENIRGYERALAGIPSIVCYALKANNNIHLLSHIREWGCGAALVSGGEVRLALEAGFSAARMVFNGNGKTRDEIRLAAQNGVMMNIDSEFDVDHIEEVAKRLGTNARTLLRINPDIDPNVHPYVSTGMRDSKFGVAARRVNGLLDRIEKAPHIDLVGIHCHLGSTITDVAVFRAAVSSLIPHLEAFRRRGMMVKCVNIGGGLGIDYEGTRAMPTPEDLIGAVREFIPGDALLIVEPGRSIVGSAGVLVTRVLGVKSDGAKSFIVVDGSMSELIRPSLYQAYHHIVCVEPVPGPPRPCDVVGPVCESGDFLGKDRSLPLPREGLGVAVLDAGAYGYAMSSNYNARPKIAEYLVDGGRLHRIRKAERWHDQRRLFVRDEILLDGAAGVDT